MKILYIFIVMWGIFPLAGCNTKTSSEAPKVKLDSDQEKFSYAMGYEMGVSMKRQNVNLHYKAFEVALADAMEGRKERLTSQQRRDIMKKISQEKYKEREAKAKKNLEEAKVFLEANKKEKGVQVTSTGLQYKIIEAGKGAKPTLNDTVEVHYKGTLLDGTVFDSSYKKQKPAQLPLRAVLPGWSEGLQLMGVGSKYMLYLPPKLAYGSRGTSKIPGNSSLIFEVELISINPKKKVSQTSTPGKPRGTGNQPKKVTAEGSKTSGNQKKATGGTPSQKTPGNQPKKPMGSSPENKKGAVEK